MTQSKSDIGTSTTAPDGPGTTALADLHVGFAGGVILPGDPAYDEARAVFNTMIDRRPGVIAQCESVEDVARAIRFGRELGLETAVRCGGHSVAGTALTDGGIVVDLRRMNEVVVDPDERTVRVAGGATMSALDRATEPHGLVTTGGRVSTTGIGGFTLGGGSGWLERKFGLACDNLLSAELVTAEGDTVRASAEENPELFWALHGGGGNFGVVTSFTFRLHPLPSFSAALLLWRSEAGPEVAHAYRDFMDSAPDEVGGGFFYLTAPPEAFVPEHLVGTRVCAVLVTYTGDLDGLRQLADPVLELNPDGRMIAELPYSQLQSMLDDDPGYRNYWSAEYLGSLPDQAVDLFCSQGEKMISPSPSLHALWRQGGAVGRVRADYPIPWRRAPWAVHPLGMWEDPADDERGKRWVHDIGVDMRPWAIGAVYLNFIGNEGEERVIAGYGIENYKRLAAVKAQYDPHNVFHLNHNIKPS
ncbi:FAD/FMN-containing dehydrogenase [Spinactinospora alkalitolerans]|uniref:FAD/FMN-containing dehydrogenase n=1 Tax=Spinactinospora alkalitolerans TaxID=687207 RepID=A0A852TSE2_9ACTN|nr:FAD-binding oxidoreductase [Spinactinospora alkalitolerans]NYE44900.1 FAD/FMN-containing dehydrogenase [Spinactinospora alkalitolerans]